MKTETAVMPRKPKRNDEPAKIDAEVMRMCRLICAHEHLPLAEFISETLRPIVTKKVEELERRGLVKPPRR